MRESVHLCSKVLRRRATEVLQSRGPQHQEALDAPRPGQHDVASEPMRCPVHSWRSLHVHDNRIE
eukprot:1762303-Lingulodinium_polyedra.AAC.1